jgi:hypothetical protein
VTEQQPNSRVSDSPTNTSHTAHGQVLLPSAHTGNLRGESRALRHPQATLWQPGRSPSACTTCPRQRLAAQTRACGLRWFGRRSGTLTCPMSAYRRTFGYLAAYFVGHLNFQYVNVMTNDIGIAHDDLIAKRATGAHGPTGTWGRNSRCRSNASSREDAGGSDVGARACELEMQHIEHARGELDELRAMGQWAMRTFASVRKARITRASLAFRCSRRRRRVPRSPKHRVASVREMSSCRPM